jgi:putative ATP-dependent endonuclease of OLD family
MTYIKKVNIKNYKCFENFTINLNHEINIIVGDNESGKSTIVEAIHLALSGLLNGKYIKNEMSQYIFNKTAETTYIESLHSNKPIAPPSIVIEIFLQSDNLPEFTGDLSRDSTNNCGIRMKIEFDDEYQEEYEELVKDTIRTIPIEYYKVVWESFAHSNITTRNIPVKSLLIDSTATRFKNGSDIYISKIIKDDLVTEELVHLTQAYRKLKEVFMAEPSIENLNNKINKDANISTKEVKVSVDLSTKNSWETFLMTYLDEIPFHQIGKGEQCLIKTNIALAHKETKVPNVILIEEPESHLSHTKLNQFIRSIIEKQISGSISKQIIITTHNNFVANKLNIKNLILLNNQKTFSFDLLDKETYEFFEKLPGYDTLRLILCKKAILVEGPSDELIIQRAFMDKNNNKLPIEYGIDVISVKGLAFSRFLDIAKVIKKPVAVVTDNDGDFENNIGKKYESYKKNDFIKISSDNRNELRTIEFQLTDANKNNLKSFCELLGIDFKNYGTEELIRKHMAKKENKTKYALKIFTATQNIAYPEFINDVIRWCADEQ